MNTAKKNPPKVTVITPLYNTELFIAETIKSVQEQTYPHWEMLIIDDCSKDNGCKIVESIAHGDSRIRLIKRDSNSGGPAAPRNVGLCQAKGEYIAFLDADDLWYTDKLEKQVRYLEDNPEIFLLYAKMVTKVQNVSFQKVNSRFDLENSDNRFQLLLQSGNIVPILTVMIRNQNSSNFLFDEDPRIITCEDFDFWLQLAYANKKFAFMELPLSVYRQHDNNISKGILNSLQKNLFLLKKWRAKVSFLFTVKLYFLLIWRRGVVMLIRSVTPHATWSLLQKYLQLRKKTPADRDVS
ncbi:MAG: glycosyltransferase [Magnetococcales bacterium]|nr:glycosyltransferase [Magnetococcales bacterium]